MHARIHTEPKPVVMRSLLYILYYSCILTVRTKFSRVLRHYLSLFFPPSFSSISGHKLVPDVDGVCIMYYIFGMYIVYFFFFSFTPFYLSDFIPFLSLSLLARYIYVHTLYRPDPYAFPSLPIIFFHGFLFNRQSTSRYGLMAMILHSRSTSRGRVIRRQIRSDARVDNFGLGWRRWVVQSTVDNPIKRAAKNIRTNSRMCTRFEFFPRFAIFHFSAEGVLLFFSLSLSLVYVVEPFHFLLGRFLPSILAIIIIIILHPRANFSLPCCCCCCCFLLFVGFLVRWFSRQSQKCAQEAK